MYKNLVQKFSDGLVIYRNTFNTESNWRYDEYYKFIFTPKGTMIYQLNHHDIKIEQQQFLLLNPHTKHRQVHFDVEKLLIGINPKTFQLTFESLGFSPSHQIQFAEITGRNPLISKWASFVLDYLQSDDFHEHPAPDHKELTLFMENSITQLILSLIKGTLNSHTHDLNVNYVQKTAPNLYNVLNAIKQSYEKSWSLDEMAKIAGLSKFQFAHSFKEQFGISPYSWIQLYRIMKTQKELIHTDEKIILIAFRHGFTSLSSYNRLFKKIYGMTPGQFRQRYQDLPI
ncbi:MAG: helix-turn-helix transcriptional regulator [Bacillaceae bacterium]|nr:helix-turn-helix transcriptional regulator [Bacillaceae bacterium]